MKMTYTDILIKLDLEKTSHSKKRSSFKSSFKTKQVIKKQKYKT